MSNELTLKLTNDPKKAWNCVHKVRARISADDVAVETSISYRQLTELYFQIGQILQEQPK